MDDRGQLFTLEGVIAALVVLSSVLFALTTTAATPLSSSTSNQHIEVQQGAELASLLDAASSNGDLRSMLLYWDDEAAAFDNSTTKGYYLACSSDSPFGQRLERTIDRRGGTCNVNIRFVNADGNVRSQKVVYVGDPTDNAVRVTRIVTLYDADRLVLASGEESNITLENATSFYAPDIDPGPVYNVVEVEVIVWRM